MTHSPDAVLGGRELAELHRQGVKPERFYPSTGEMLVWINDQPYGYPLAHIKRMANPTLVERFRNWIGGIAA